MERVIYNKNPLKEVILQFKFPTILLINSEEPVKFQEAIRGEYPIYKGGRESEREIKGIKKGEFFLPLIKKTNEHKNHCFFSVDQEYKVNLTDSFISISTFKYLQWEKMLGKFETALNKFIEIYKPPFFERIGLRYINAFSKEKLGLTDKKWKDLIKSKWLGPLGDTERSMVNEGNIVNIGIDVEFLLNERGSMGKVHSGFGTIFSKSQAEKVFIIDVDFVHRGNIKMDEYKSIREELHDHSESFIRSAIKQALHTAMEPRKLQ